MRFGASTSGNTKADIQNDGKRDHDAKSEGPGDWAHQGYKVLSKAEPGKPREMLSDQLGWDTGPMAASDYPDR